MLFFKDGVHTAILEPLTIQNHHGNQETLPGNIPVLVLYKVMYCSIISPVAM